MERASERPFSAEMTVDGVRFDMRADLAVPESVKRDFDVLRSTSHTHASFELFVVLSGTVKFFPTGSTPLAAHTGDVVVIPPHLAHFPYEEDRDGRCAAVSFFFSPVPKEEGELYLLLRPLAGEGAPIFLSAVAQAPDTMRQLLAEIRRGDRQLAALTFVKLIVTVAFAHAKQTERDAAHEIPSDEMNRIAVFDSFINDRFTTRVTADDIAKELFLSHRQLSRLVRKYYGTTLTDLLATKRVEAAEHLLSSTNLPVAEIAARVGFRSSATFYRDFARIAGKKPSDVRR